jgi:hypothetical protein
VRADVLSKPISFLPPHIFLSAYPQPVVAPVLASRFAAASLLCFTACEPPIAAALPFCAATNPLVTTTKPFCGAVERLVAASDPFPGTTKPLVLAGDGFVTSPKTFFTRLFPFDANPKPLVPVFDPMNSILVLSKAPKEVEANLSNLAAIARERGNLP